MCATDMCDMICRCVRAHGDTSDTLLFAYSDCCSMLVLAVDVMYARATHVKGLDEVGGK